MIFTAEGTGEREGGAELSPAEQERAEAVRAAAVKAAGSQAPGELYSGKCKWFSLAKMLRLCHAGRWDWRCVRAPGG